MNFPCKIFDTTGTSVIGIAYNSYDVLTILVNNPTWNSMGTPYNIVKDEVLWYAAGGNTQGTIPSVKYDVNVTKQDITGTSQMYQVNITDISSRQATVLDLPMNIIINVTYGNLNTGSVNLGNFSFAEDIPNAINNFLLSLNSPPVTTVTASLANYETLLAVVIKNTNIAVPVSVAITTDVLSSSYIAYGANNKKNSTLGTEIGFNLSNNRTTDSLSPVDIGDVFHTILIGNNMLTVAGNTGLVYSYDMTNPNYPKLRGTIQLTDISTNFTGSPHYNNNPWFWSVYFVTDLNNEDPTEVYVVETLSGTIWKINAVNLTVIGGFQYATLIGKCPRVLINNTIYFTQDGNIESATGQNSGIAPGSIVTLDTTVTFDNKSLSSIDLVTGNNIVAASANNNGYIYFIDSSGNVIVFDAINLAIVSTTLTFTTSISFVNAKLLGNLLFLCITGVGTFTLNLDTLAVTTFDLLQLPSGASPNTAPYNFLPLNNSIGILTFDNSTYPAGMAKYTLSGKFISLLSVPFNIYNIIPFIS